MRRRGLFMGVVVVGMAVAGCGDDGGAASSACRPVGDGGGSTVAVTLDEWSVQAEQTSVAAGTVTFDVHNAGEEPHELVVVKGVPAEQLRVVDGKVDEGTLPEGAFVGEVEAFPGGEDCKGTFELSAGSYVLFCNIVEQHDGKQESHFREGMVTTFEVR